MTGEPTHTAKNGAACISYINCRLKKVKLCFQPYSTHYSAVQINNCSKSTEVAAMPISVTKGSHHVLATTKLALFAVSHDDETLRRTPVSL